MNAASPAASISPSSRVDAAGELRSSLRALHALSVEVDVADPWGRPAAQAAVAEQAASCELAASLIEDSQLDHLVRLACVAAVDGRHGVVAVEMSRIWAHLRTLG